MREKNELPWKVNIFLAFSFIFFQNMEMKGKNTEKSFFLKKYIYFLIEMACSTFYVTWKWDFLQNVVKTNKKVDYITLKRKTIRYSELFMFLTKHGKSKKILKNSISEVKT